MSQALYDFLSSAVTFLVDISWLNALLEANIVLISITLEVFQLTIDLLLNDELANIPPISITLEVSQFDKSPSNEEW
ncbi:Uncharacterised protein, partial [Mycoplasma putrefaciens]